MDPKLEEQIQTSGNNLHMEVADALENMGWEVDLSAYYYDDTANKPREIDIIAKRPIITFEGHLQNKDDWQRVLKPAAYVFLFIECKHFLYDVAFRTHKASVKDNEEAVIMQGVINKDDMLGHNNRATRHRFSRLGRVAKLYDDSTDRKDENKAIFNAITQPLKSLTFIKERDPQNGLYYPVVVYKGIPGIYIIESQDDLNNLQNLSPRKDVYDGTNSDVCLPPFNVNYSYRSVVDKKQELKRQRFYVEFVHKDELAAYIKVINTDVQQFAGYLRSKKAEQSFNQRQQKNRQV